MKTIKKSIWNKECEITYSMDEPDYVGVVTITKITHEGIDITKEVGNQKIMWLEEEITDNLKGVLW